MLEGLRLAKCFYLPIDRSIFRFYLNKRTYMHGNKSKSEWVTCWWKPLFKESSLVNFNYSKTNISNWIRRKRYRKKSLKLCTMEWQLNFNQRYKDYIVIVRLDFLGECEAKCSNCPTFRTSLMLCNSQKPCIVCLAYNIYLNSDKMWIFISINDF